MQLRAPDVEVVEPGVGELNQQQNNTGFLAGVGNSLFGNADRIRTTTRSTQAPEPGLSGDDIVEATAPGGESNIEFDTEITDDLTRGGILSERPDTSEGLLPGTVGPINLSEQGFRTASENVSSYTESFEENEPVTIAGSELPENVLQGLAGAGVEAAAGITQAPAFADTAVEMATQAPGEVREEGAVDVAQAVGRLGLVTGQETVRGVRENPVESTATLVGSAAVSAGTGAALGRGSRVFRDRVRTLGGQRLDLEDLTPESVARYQRTGGAEGERFPGAEDPDQYQSDPAEAVRQQAEQPEAVQDLFDDDGTILTKALGVEPEGPGRGRAGQGFQSVPGESLEEFDYETPGSFVGPDVSPNFLGIEQRAGFSLRPGLPGLGSQPTGLLVRTDVENPDADTLDGFNQEMIDRGGETTAVTKPSDEVNPGEIEAVVPPGAEFADVGGGPIRNTLRSLGIGSDLYTEVQGRRVPLRGVVPDADADTDTPPTQFGFDNRAQADLSGRRGPGPAFTGTLDELSGTYRRGTDRPFPVVPVEQTSTQPAESPEDLAELSNALSESSESFDSSGSVPDPSTAPTSSFDGSSVSPSGGLSDGGTGSSPTEPSSIPSGGSGGPLGGSGGSSTPSDPGEPTPPTSPPSTPPSEPGEPTPPTSPPSTPPSEPSDWPPSSPPGPPNPPSSPPGPPNPPTEPPTRPPRYRPERDGPDQPDVFRQRDVDEKSELIDSGIASPEELLGGSVFGSAESDSETVFGGSGDVFGRSNGEPFSGNDGDVFGGGNGNVFGSDGDVFGSGGLGEEWEL
ncbi:hypothetical protein [Halosimplex carlsbadense]|uniref:hypothetical protein n=1 Tax=Halosimplex carlsbadense TaxID=171164 RepID=UPI00126902AA|nr:hypothetical protein [Halosimplex carlsbadense]